jgi:hypothetical protein
MFKSDEAYKQAEEREWLRRSDETMPRHRTAGGDRA